MTTPAAGNPIITIVGAGMSLTFIDANRIDRVMRVHPDRTVNIRDLTIRGGFAANDSGAGILDTGTVTLTRVAVTDNRAENFGGGIAVFKFTTTPALTVQDSMISANFAVTDGGGIDSGWTLNIIRSTIAGNTAASGPTSQGGGVNVGGPTLIRDSTISGNTSTNGGGISSDGSSTYIINSTISSNNALVDGGGIRANSGNISLRNVSVVNNDADHDHDENGGNGGGLFIRAGTRLTVFNSLVAGNTIRNTPIYDDCNGIVEAYGRNLLGTLVGCPSSNAPMFGMSINTIGPLKDNGGPTQTHALLAGSEAIGGSIATFGCLDETNTRLTKDQRGAPRPHPELGICDIGAFQSGASVP